MSVWGLIRLCRRQNVVLYWDGETVRCQAPPSKVTSRLRRQLACRREELRAALEQLSKDAGKGRRIYKHEHDEGWRYWPPGCTKKQASKFSRVKE